MDFYEQSRLLSEIFLRWEDPQIVLFNRDEEIVPGREGAHCHESYEFRMLLTADRMPVGPLELFQPGVMHYSWPIKAIDASFSISFEPLLLRYRNEQPVFFTSPYEDKITEFLAGLKAGGPLPGNIREECRLLCSLLFLRAKPAAEPTHSNSVELMGHYMSRHYYRSDFSIRDLAIQFGYSPNYIQRCFRKMFGMSPREYLLEIRMRAAIRLMQMKSCRIKELASLCGFQDVHHFSKTFRRYYGVSPSDYLAKIRKDKLNQK